MIASPIIDTDLIVDFYHGLQAMLYLSQNVILDSPELLQYSLAYWTTATKRGGISV